MKRIFLLITLLGVMISCETKKSTEKEIAAIDWILLSPKPILCYPYDTKADGTIYTLVNSERGVYMTGRIKLELSDTIK